MEEAMDSHSTLLYDQFRQEVERLVQHKEMPAQKKLLSKLLWPLRARQQAHQFDLLALCRLMEWLPTGDSKVLSLLNNEAPDWYPTLKAHGIRPQLAVFQDRYPTETITEISDLLAQLPWKNTLTGYFLQTVAAGRPFSFAKAPTLFK